jgi:hypothetical protein
MLMTEDLQARSGGCLCGAVRFRTRGKLRGVIYCHCSQCRRQTGLHYAATDVDRDSIVVEGEDALSWFNASPEASRGFCRTCGSALFWQEIGSSRISVMAGAFDQPSGLVGGSHIFTADKGDFYEITDDLPRFPGSQSGSAG